MNNFCWQCLVAVGGDPEAPGLVYCSVECATADGAFANGVWNLCAKCDALMNTDFECDVCHLCDDCCCGCYVSVHEQAQWKVCGF